MAVAIILTTSVAPAIHPTMMVEPRVVQKADRNKSAPSASAVGKRSQVRAEPMQLPHQQVTANKRPQSKVLLLMLRSRSSVRSNNSVMIVGATTRVVKRRNAHHVVLCFNAVPLVAITTTHQK
jgi:hypothetical protein